MCFRFFGDFVAVVCLFVSVHLGFFLELLLCSLQMQRRTCVSRDFSGLLSCFLGTMVQRQQCVVGSWELAAVGTEESHDGKRTGCTGSPWINNKASWAFLVLQRLKSAPVAQYR